MHRKTRNSAIAVVTAGAAALTVAALRAPSPFTETASAASAGSARSAADGAGHAGSGAANAAVANMARQSTFALQRAHDQTRHQQEETRQRRQTAKPAATHKATAHHTAAAPARRPAPTTHHTVATRPAATPTASAAPTASASPTATATPAATATATATPTTVYANDLDGWIKQALAVMAQHKIPGTYDGIYRNIMRESSGDPNAVNNWDSNAAKGTPSKGLLQVIQPTFDTYHVAGTSDDIMDPVANIVAACNYAAAMYGSIDNVYSAY